MTQPIGGYLSWGAGSALVTDTGGELRFELDFEYKFYDRYKWEKGNMQGIFGPDGDFWDPHQVKSLRTGQVKRPDARALHVGYGESLPGTTVVYVMEHGT